jgi:hypothetical protein
MKLQKLKMYIFCALAILLLGFYPMEICSSVHQNICSRMFIADLLITEIAKYLNITHNKMNK